MLTDDRPTHPMHIVTRLRFAGTMQRERLDQALQAARECHPFFMMQLQNQGRRCIWIPARQSVRVQWLTSAPGPVLDHLELHRYPGLRVYARLDGGHTELFLQAHHAVCDGLGLMGFIEDLLLHYARTGSDPAHHPHPVRNPALLSRRHRLGLSRGQFLRACFKQGRALYAMLLFLRRPARPLYHGELLHESEPERLPAFDTQRLDSAFSSHLLRSARNLGVTFNDLLLCTLFMVLKLHAQHEPSASPWTRLCVPVNFRQSAHRSLPAANLISLTFLTRRDQDMRCRRNLLQSIHQEMMAIKRNHEGLTFNLGLGLFRRLGKLKGQCEPSRCRASAVLSNLGILFDQHPLRDLQGGIKLDNLTLEGIDFVPPIRPHTHLSLGVFTYAGQLHLTYHYDDRILNRRHVKQLMDDVMTELKDWLR